MLLADGCFGEIVVVAEVAGSGGLLARYIAQPPGNLCLDIFCEGARARASSEDSLDGFALEGGEGARVREGFEEIIGAETLAQKEDLAAVIAREPRHRLRELRKEGRRFFTK